MGVRIKRENQYGYIYTAIKADSRKIPSITVTEIRTSTGTIKFVSKFLPYYGSKFEERCVIETDSTS